MKTKEANLGRPRSTVAHNQVLAAAICLFAERGIDGTSMDAIAEVSGVSKATIYKHWPDKDALCLEVMLRVHGLDQERPVLDSGDLHHDLVDLLKYKPPEHPSGMRERLMPHLMAYAARNQKFGMAWRARVIEPSRVQVVEILERGIEQGRFPADLDMRLAVAMLIGPMMYSKIFGCNVAMPENFAEGVVGAFWRAFAKAEVRPMAAPKRKSRASAAQPASRLQRHS